MLTSEVVSLFLHNRKFKNSASGETIKTYTYALGIFTRFMEDRNKIAYSSISRVDIAAFNEHIRQELDTGAWSLSKYLLVIKTLKAMFHWMEQDDDCKEEELKSWRSRMPKGAKAPKRERIPSVSDLKQWMRTFNTKTMTGLRDYMMFCVMLETGVRRGELATLRVQNVQIDRKLIYVNGKTGDRIVTITDALADRLRAYLRKKEHTTYGKSPYLFPSRMNMEQPVNAQYITQTFRRIAKAANLPKLTPHTLRHSFCTYFLINGGDVESLRLQSGHKTYDSMLHYLHLAKVGGGHAAQMMERVSPLKMIR